MCTFQHSTTAGVGVNMYIHEVVFRSSSFRFVATASSKFLVISCQTIACSQDRSEPSPSSSLIPRVSSFSYVFKRISDFSSEKFFSLEYIALCSFKWSLGKKHFFSLKNFSSCNILGLFDLKRGNSLGGFSEFVFVLSKGFWGLEDILITFGTKKTVICWNNEKLSEMTRRKSETWVKKGSTSFKGQANEEWEPWATAW